MAVYHNGVETHIECGSIDEGWVAVRPPGEPDTDPIDVPLGTLSADDPDTEIYDRIPEQNDLYPIQWDDYLPLRVRINKETVYIESTSNHRIKVFDVADMLDMDDYEAMEYVMDVLHAVNTAQSQPRRTLFHYHDNL